MKDLKIIKEKTCALTGHRTVEKDFEVDVLREIFIKLIDAGINTFLCGMAVGFDTLAFKVLYNLKKEKSLRIIACIPCPNQDIKFNEIQKIEYEKMLEVADERVLISKEYNSECMMKRNMFMVDNAFVLLAYLRKEKGGAKNTVTYAIKNNKTVIYV
mgnify:FL=1